MDSIQNTSSSFDSEEENEDIKDLENIEKLDDKKKKPRNSIFGTLGLPSAQQNKLLAQAPRLRN